MSDQTIRDILSLSAHQPVPAAMRNKVIRFAFSFNPNHFMRRAIQDWLARR